MNSSLAHPAAPPRRIRVLVVEDSLTVRKRLLEVLGDDPELEVVGEAEDGKRGVELCQALRPDVITLDMMMPVMSGLAATEFIMAYCPTPILIVSSSTNRGEVFGTFEALAAGAVDVMEKPRGGETDERWERKVRATVKLVSRIKVITHVRARLGRAAGGAPAAAAIASVLSPEPDRQLVALGASTGGPGAILRILSGLPGSYPLPILFVLHIGVAFGTAFAEWLGGQTALPVVYASDGAPLPRVGQPGVIMAPPDRHLIVRDGRLRLTAEAERHFCRPSVDVLFESLARECGERTIACLLTGMGRDGAAGLLAIRQAGGLTMAQDEATSVVFGMPMEAIALGAAARVLPLDGFAPALCALAEARPAAKPPA